MMIIETGDLFVVTRGIELNSTPLMSLFGFGESWKTSGEGEKIRYDRSWDNVVFVAKSVVGQSVAAEIVWAGGYKKDMVGQHHSLNLSEVEAMTVGADYLSALSGDKS